MAECCGCLQQLAANIRHFDFSAGQRFAVVAIERISIGPLRPGTGDQLSQGFVVGAAPERIASVTPSTNPTATVINNAISMIAGGNSVIFAPHPNAKRASQTAIQVLNKAIIEAATNVAHVDMLAKYDALNPTALKQLVAAKTKVLPFSQAVMDASFKASMEVFAENDAKSPEWKKIYADMRAFQRDQILWFRFAEARYDTFMSAQKI